jgi:uroporphyrinogen-III synthase
MPTRTAHAAGRPARAPANDASTSEGLLLMPELVGCEQRRIAILGGAGGRSLLVDRLSARGAHVTKIALYQRLPVSIEKTRLIELAGECDVIVVTSGEALAHLLDLARVSRLDLSGHGLVAPSQRVVQQSGQQLRWAAPPVPLVRMGAAHIASAVAHAWPRRRQ